MKNSYEFEISKNECNMTTHHKLNDFIVVYWRFLLIRIQNLPNALGIYNKIFKLL